MAAKKKAVAKKAAPKKMDGGASRAAGRKRVQESRNRQGIREKQGPMYTAGDGSAMIPGNFGPMSPVERKAKQGSQTARVLGASNTWGSMNGFRYAMPMRNKKK